MKKVLMVLEGGAFRGLFTAGVLDVLMENNIDISCIVGVSAGALFGVNYFSKQKGRVIRYNKKYCGNPKYMSLRSLITTGNFINKKFAFYKVTKELDPFDNEEFIKTNKDFYAVITNIETGKPEYLKIKNPLEDLEILRASSAVPLISKNIKINNQKYLDGGISDSIPINYLKDKYQKKIVILTQPIDYKKKPLSPKKEKIIKLKYHKYPNLINTMKNRHQAYNQTIKEILEMENNGEIFVIRPKQNLDIKINETNQEKFQSIYDHGIDIGKKTIKELKKYLEN